MMQHCKICCIKTCPLTRLKQHNSSVIIFQKQFRGRTPQIPRLPGRYSIPLSMPQLQLSPDIKQLFLSNSNYYFHVKKQFIIRTIYSQNLMILWAEANELQQVLMYITSSYLTDLNWHEVGSGWLLLFPEKRVWATVPCQQLIKNIDAIKNSVNWEVTFRTWFLRTKALVFSWTVRLPRDFERPRVFITTILATSKYWFQ